MIKSTLTTQHNVVFVKNILLRRIKKVRDHCHFTGKYRGAAHQKCNALFRKPKFVPVKFHNKLSGYDAHLCVKNLNMMEKAILTVYQILKRNTLVSQKVFMQKENSNTNFGL